MLRNNVRKRTYRDITAEILQIAMKGANKTYIVYQANLNFKLLGRYLQRLEKEGLITYNRVGVETTKKGIEYLRHFEALKGLGA